MSTINERIIAAVAPVVPVCVPGVYAPDAGEAAEAVYCTFNYTEHPAQFGDDGPGVLRYQCQVHFFAPRLMAAGVSGNTLATRKALRRALFAAGFTYPSVTDASDWADTSSRSGARDYQHFVFEFEDTDGEV